MTQPCIDMSIYWRTKEGTIIHYKNMSLTHMERVYKLLLDKAVARASKDLLLGNIKKAIDPNNYIAPIAINILEEYNRKTGKMIKVGGGFKNDNNDTSNN